MRKVFVCVLGLCLMGFLCRADGRTSPEPVPCCPAVSLASPASCGTVALTFTASGEYAPPVLPCGSTIESYVLDANLKVVSKGTAKTNGGKWVYSHTVPAGKGYEVVVTMTKTAAFDSASGITAK